MKTTQEIIQELENEINSTGTVGLNIQILAARLDYASKIAAIALRNLQTAYETMGNNTMVKVVASEITKFKTTLP